MSQLRFFPEPSRRQSAKQPVARNFLCRWSVQVPWESVFAGLMEPHSPKSGTGVGPYRGDDAAHSLHAICCSRCGPCHGRGAVRSFSIGVSLPGLGVRGAVPDETTILNFPPLARKARHSRGRRSSGNLLLPRTRVFRCAKGTRLWTPRLSMRPASTKNAQAARV